MNRIWQLGLLIFVLSTLACNSQKFQGLESFGPGIVIVNEGNFTMSNASLSFYDFESGQTIDQVFYLVNGFKLGDVAQSAIELDGKIFVVVNNSGKIVVLDSKTFKFQGEIAGLVSPRYILPVDDSLAYVTDLYSRSLSVVNYKTFQKVGNVDIGATSEAIVKYGDYAFVTNWSYGNKVFRINVKTNQVDSLVVGYQPNSLVVDKYQRLWVLSDGGLGVDSERDTLPSLTVIDIASFQKQKVFYFDSLDISPTHLVANLTQDTLYFLVSAWQKTQNEHFGIYRMAVDDTVLPANVFITQGNYTFYSLQYVATLGLVVCDAQDFVQPGNVLIFNPYTGGIKNQFSAGIIPGQVLVKN